MYDDMTIGVDGYTILVDRIVVVRQQNHNERHGHESCRPDG